MVKHTIKKFLFTPYLPGVIWAFFIALVCIVRPPSIKNLDNIKLIPIDKIAHFILFAGLMYLIVLSKKKYTITYKQALIIAMFSWLYGGCIELIQQYFFTYRSGSWGDFIADGMGVLSVFLYAKHYKFNLPFSFFK